MVHLQKLAAGIARLEDLRSRQDVIRERMHAQGFGDRLVVETKNQPRRAGIQGGGSLYWIFAGAMQCRQLVRAFHAVEDDAGRSRCLIELEPLIIRVRAVPRKPFQGWRYLSVEDAPPDLDEARETALLDLPDELREALDQIGIL